MLVSLIRMPVLRTSLRVGRLRGSSRCLLPCRRVEAAVVVIDLKS